MFSEGVRAKEAGLTQRTGALRILMQAHDPKFLKLLCGYLTKDSPEVRVTAAEGVGEYAGSAEAGKALVAAAGNGENKKSPEVRVAILKALGAVGDVSGAKTANDAIREDNLEVALAGVEASGRLKTKTSVDALLAEYKRLEPVSPGGKAPKPGKENTESAEDRLAQRRATLVPAIHRNLTQLTGFEWPSCKDWEDWWRKEKANFGAAAAPPPPAPPPPATPAPAPAPAK